MAEVDINQSYRWLGGIFRQVFSLQGDISPSQITADQDDYNPTGLSTAAILRLSTDATRNINGISGGSDGRVIKIVNVGTQGIVLKDEASTSTAANRFALNTDVTISENQAVELWYDSTSSRWRLFGGTGGTVVLPPDQENGVVSGGTVTWIEDYDYEVAESFYYINNILYHSPRTTITLNASDPTDDRIDLFVLTTSNTADKVTGSVSTPPAEPNYDPSTQLKISFAFVENGTTEPVVTQTWIYRENAGTPTEWAYTDNSANLNPASTSNPFAGTLDIEGTAVGSGNNFTLTASASPSFSLYDAVVFKIRSKASWTTNLSIRFFNGTTALGNTVLFGHGSYGFDSSSISAYQNVNIPLSAFGLITGADRITFQRMVGGGTIGFYIDDIQLMLTGEASTIQVPISSLLPALAANTINNANHLQTWQWNTIAGGTALKLSTTSALTNNLQKILEIAMTGANAGSSEATYGIYISNGHTGTSPINYGIFATTSGTGRSVYGECTGTGNGGRFTNTSTGIALFVQSGTGTGIDVQTGAATFNSRFLMTTALTTTIQSIISLQHQTSGTAAAGFGLAINFTAETNGNNGRDMCLVGARWSDATDATRQSTAFISARNINDIVEKLNLFGHYTALTEATATAFLRINIPISTVAGGEIIVTVEANDSTDFQSRTLRFIWSAVNKANTTTVAISTPEEVVAASTGTLTATITAVDAGSGNVDFKIDATSSLTQTTLRANAVLIKNFGTGTITPQ